MAQTPAQKQQAYRDRLRARQAGIPAPSTSNFPQTKRWKGLLQNAQALLSQTAFELQDYADRRSETWQESDKAQSIADTITAIEEALEAVNNIEL